MKAIIAISAQEAAHINLAHPMAISIPISNGANNPNCYWAEPVKFKTIEAEGFIGSVKKGGPVNYQQLVYTPHGNGTHTECYGHITDSGATVNQQLNSYHFYCKVLSVAPVVLPNNDQVLPLTQAIKNQNWENVQALAIRTLPNTQEKLTRNYSGTNPPYVSPELTQFIVHQGIEHLLIDLPSVDKEVDGGKLEAHRLFWGLPHALRKKSTLTELIFIPNSIADGNYLLNLQLINLEMDASPSHPVLYKIEKITPILG